MEASGSEKPKTRSLKPFAAELNVLLRAEPGKVNLVVPIGNFFLRSSSAKISGFFVQPCKHKIFDNFIEF